MSKDDLFTKDVIRKLFTYRDGHLIHNKRLPDTGYNSTFNKRYAGRKVGAIGTGSYIRTHIRLNNKGYGMLVHRLIFCYHHGYFPEFIDHINGIRSDNRIENLRATTKTENFQNMCLRKDNKSGCHGVSIHKHSGLWHARITVDKRIISLGYFKDKDSAILARKKADRKYGFHKNHGRTYIR